MKRAPGRLTAPNDILEVPAARPDPRSADPQATQKISRAQLEEALKRTKSGTRRAVKSEPDLDGVGGSVAFGDDGSYAGPRDDDEGPLVTIVRIDSMELEPIDPLSLPPIRSTPMSAMMSPVVLRTPATPAMPGTPALEVMPDPHAPRLVRRRRWATERLHITPRVAFAAGALIALCMLLAALVGFFAGRLR